MPQACWLPANRKTIKIPDWLGKWPVRHQRKTNSRVNKSFWTLMTKMTNGPCFLLIYHYLSPAGGRGPSQGCSLVLCAEGRSSVSLDGWMPRGQV